MAFQRSFIAGEIGPSLYGGADQARYNAALSTCRNFLVQRSGGVANRPGSQFVAEVKDSTTRTTLAKFVFNSDQTYVIEAGAGYIRFYRQGARVVVSSPAAWSGATAYVIGDVVVSGGVNYYCILGHTNHVPPNATYWYALSGNIFEIPTPYAAADLDRLQYVQSGDVVTLTHRGYRPMELKRYSNRWTLTEVSTAPAIAAPAGLAWTVGNAGTLPYSYVVTAVAEETYEESVPPTPVAHTSAAPTAANPNALTWTAVSGAAEYNVYVDQAGNGTYGFIGVASSTSFNDVGYTPDMSTTPPIPRTLFASSGNYPQSVAYFQQRQLFASTDNDPETVFASKTGAFKNFTISSPIQDDDAITFTLAGRLISEVRHLVEAGRALILLTSSGEWQLAGSADGVLTPTAINVTQEAYYGSSHVVPVVVGNSVIYVQARGGFLRDLRFDYSQINAQHLDGRDLTIFAPHLIEGYSIDRIDYAQIPNSIVWAIRSDGTLLGLTYLREFDVWGWHRHDTDGAYEDVISVPETTPPPPGSTTRGKEEDAVYVIVRRTINGSTKRYVERFASRRVEDYRLDGYFLDSFLTYNGINATSATVTLSTAAGWTTSDLITVTASTATFSAGDVGNGVTVWQPGVGVVRIAIETYVSSTVVKGHPNLTVPPGLRSTATTNWSRAVDEVTGLSHLEGKTVSILANGVVLSGTVTSGKVTLANVYDVIHVGLPITADFETLDIDSAQKDIRDKRKLITQASLLVDRSRGILAGPDEDHLSAYHASIGDELGFDIFDSTGGKTRSALLEVNLEATWEQPGRIFVRQTDPLPLAILGVIPNGPIGG